MEQCLGQLQELLSTLKTISHLVEDGKAVHAHRQLQGARTRVVNLIELIIKESSEKTDVVETPNQI
jgi:hypothetical protein